MENRKYKKYGKVCAAIGGAALVTAALSGMVGASDAGLSGLDKSFFYDDNYNPNVQVVVGEKASALDVIGGGNIAATIGNLAYKTSSGGACTGEGVVKLAVKSWGLVGKYEKMSSSTIDRDFYTSSGVAFDSSINYKHGSWKDYNIACTVQKKMAEFPMKEEMCNEVCYLCYGICQEEIKHVTHKMEEDITVDANNVRFYEDGLGDSDSEALKMRVEGGSLKYHVKLDGIPTSTLKSGRDLVDSAYRGKMLFMGSNEYYVKDLAASGPSITLAKGKKMTINNMGFSEDFKGYSFQVAGFISGSSEWGSTVAGALITVQKPDGSTATVQVTKTQNGKLPEGIEIQMFNAQGTPGVAGQSSGYGTADIIVYDDTTQITLENNKNFEGWSVEILKDECNKVGISDYSYDNGVRYCLTDLSLTLNDEVTLTPNSGPLYFPTKAVKFSFEGYKTDDFKDITCSGGSDKIKIEKSGDSKLMLSFTDRDGNRYNDVRLDQGKFNTGTLFMFNGRVYEYSELKTETSGGTTTYKLILKDKFDVSDVEIPMTKKDGPVGNYNYVTFSGKENNGKSTEDSVLAGTGIYYDGTYNGFRFVVKSGSLYILNPAHTKIGVDPAIVGTLASNKIEKDDNGLNIKVVKEDGNTDLNGDGQKDDTLILFEPDNGNDVFVDFYDSGKDARTTTDWYTGISITKDSTKNYTATCGATQCGVAKLISTSDDTLLIDEIGGGTYTKNGDKQLNQVTVCHPQTQVYPTYFIGTDKNETMQEVSITADDVGKEKSAACCDFTVKAFTLTGAGNVTGGGVCNKVNAVGNIVVSDKNANTAKNLIVVGGPAVNTLAADVTKEEIGADADKYVIKKVGNKLIVAGWEAQDTNNAANKVIAWLTANVHTA